jgi:hypothetical protein
MVSDEIVKNDSELREFSEKNKFSGYFRTSAKLGININESMEYLIKTIVSKLESVELKEGKEIKEKDRKSIVLENPRYSNQNKKDNCC